jgi:uncharacterized protein YecE (DUF72 family)
MDFGRVANLDGVDFSLPSDDPRGFGGAPSPSLAIYVGAPVLGAKAWDGRLYPRGTRSGEHMAIYARRFDSLEMNNSYYAVPSEAQVARWVEATPPSFRFCPKVPRSISQGDPSEIASFSRAALGLGDRLGRAFLQVAPSWGPDDHEALWSLMARFPRELPLALELRHPGWFWRGRLIGRAFDALRGGGWATVITDTPGRRDVVHTTLTAPDVVVRFAAHDGHPTDAARVDAWLARLRSWDARGLARAFFFVHQPDEAGILAAAEAARRALQGS